MSEIKLKELTTPTNANVDITNYIKYGLGKSLVPNNNLDASMAYNSTHDTSSNVAGYDFGSYVDGLTLGQNGNIYDNSISDMLTTERAQAGFEAGPTVQNAKLYNRTDKPNDTILGLNNKQWNNVGTAGELGLGIGQLGLGIMSYLENKQTADKQRKLLDQQYASNTDLINARAKSRTNIEKAFA